MAVEIHRLILIGAIMNKPIIAIFLAGNLATEEEKKLIEKYQSQSHIILNAETYTPQESLVVDAVCGVVPDHLKGKPEPEQVIEAYKNYLAGLGKNVGGQAPKKNSEKNNGANGEQAPQTPPTNTGFGIPPTPPAH